LDYFKIFTEFDLRNDFINKLKLIYSRFYKINRFLATEIMFYRCEPV